MGADVKTRNRRMGRIILIVLALMFTLAIVGILTLN